MRKSCNRLKRLVRIVNSKSCHIEKKNANFMRTYIHGSESFQFVTLNSITPYQSIYTKSQIVCPISNLIFIWPNADSNNNT